MALSKQLGPSKVEVAGLRKEVAFLEQGLIHRDVKPANVTVRDDGTAKVLDFGPAKAIRGEAPRWGVVTPVRRTSLLHEVLELGPCAWCSP